MPSLFFSRWMYIRLRVPSGSTFWKHETTKSTGRLGENEVDVAHRRRGEPLVTGQGVAAISSIGHRLVVPARTSDPPCFSVIDIPAVIPALVAGHLELRVVHAAGQ